MYELEPVLVETNCLVPDTDEQQAVEHQFTEPVAISFPLSNVRLVEQPADKEESKPEQIVLDWSTDLAVEEGRIVIGGAGLHSLEAARARKQTAHSRGLAIVGTVSYDSYRARVESGRMAKIKNALGRIFRYIGLRPDAEVYTMEFEAQHDITEGREDLAA